MAKNKLFSKKLPFVKKIEDRKKIIKKIFNIAKYDMNLKIKQIEDDRGTVFNFNDEFEIVMEHINNKVFINMDSLMCPVKVVDLCKALFDSNIDVYKYSMIHKRPDNTILTHNVEKKRQELIDNINEIEDRKDIGQFVLSEQTSKKTFKTPPPFAKEFLDEEREEIISTITDIVNNVGRDIDTFEISDGSFVCTCSEFYIVVNPDSQIILSLESLICPTKLFELCRILFERDINVDSCVMTHNMCDGNVLFDEAAYEGRNALLRFLDEINTYNTTMSKLNKQ